MPGRNRPTPARRAAFTLVEASIGIVLVSILAVAALNTMGSAAAARLRQSQRTRALLLAEDLLCEILAQPYEDPTPGGAPGGTIGIDAGENALNRATFDDVDDYHGWTSTQATAADGAPLTWALGLGRRVKVNWASASNPAQPSISETGVKQVTVTVTRGSDDVVQLVALRARAARTD